MTLLIVDHCELLGKTKGKHDATEALMACFLKIALRETSAPEEEK